MLFQFLDPTGLVALNKQLRRIIGMSGISEDVMVDRYSYALDNNIP